ncbi:MAG: ABC transporter substrate-binding protein [Alphaproteobacteria bacterium]|nr:ABC transporter substrate-binding protein [Alphaproteobacteria bacterium]
MHRMTKSLASTAAVAVLLAAAPALAADVKLGFLADVTGPIAGFAPGMVQAGNIAVDAINAQGGILGGQTLVSVMADTGCSGDLGGPGADRLVNTEKVTAIFGAYCSGPTIAAANGAAIAGNVVMISPSATAPAVSELADSDLVFRTVVPDSMQGTKGADLLLSKGIDTVAVTYINGDYGKGLADAFKEAYEAKGGTVSSYVAHEDGKSDYRPEIGQLESAGADALVIYGYENAGGGVILDQAMESGFFTTYVGGDGMAGDALVKNHKDIDGMILTKAAPAAGPAFDAYSAIVNAAGLAPDATYASTSFDAVFLLALAIEKAGSAERTGVSAALREVANEPGETILPGEWAKAVELIKAGTDINYQGASGVIEFDDLGDVPGAIEWFEIQGGAQVSQGLIE